ncbi:MAG: hotdog fold thioesterase [Desulfobacteraceae bacterium]|nr:hotdog fold thioesterase [Desulfobacteraceae bacterium]MBC2756436.1 hotdog fold thioesterase [Desulfobacteraceae bacterium]MBC2763566.1 hotdog fold thioesterase [ANME-2 cluster archaeon]
MDENLKKAIFNAVENEPFAQKMGMKLVALALGYSKVEMDYLPESMDNIYQRAHGGVIYSLIDEAFETSCQTHGTVAVALNVNVSYIESPEPGARLTAEAKEITRSKKIAHYDISITDDGGRLIASSKTIAYRTGKPIPFYK